VVRGSLRRGELQIVPVQPFHLWLQRGGAAVVDDVVGAGEALGAARPGWP
jgi:hypothetical protein